MNKSISDPDPEPEIISKKDEHEPVCDIKKASTEIERIGDRLVKVQYTEYTGRRKRKITHIEVTRDELDKIIEESDKPLQVQFSLF